MYPERRFYPPDQLFLYGQVEFVLAHAFGAINPSDRAKLRGRYKKFQLLGLPLGERPKKGTKGKYSLSQLCELALAFEFLQFGIDPRLIVEMFTNYTDSDGVQKSCENHLDVVLDVVKMVSGKYEYCKEYSDQIIWCFEPTILAEKWTKVPDFEWVTGPCMEIMQGKMYSARLVFINLTNLAERLIDHVPYVLGLKGE